MNKEKPLPHLRGCRSASGGHRRGGRHPQGRRDRRGRSCPGTHCCSSSSEVPQNCSPYQTCRKMRKHQVIKFFRGNVPCLFSFTDSSTLSPFASLLLPPSYSFCSSIHIPVFLLLPFHTCIPGSSSSVLFSCSFLSSPVFLLLSLLNCIPVVALHTCIAAPLSPNLYFYCILSLLFSPELLGLSLLVFLSLLPSLVSLLFFLFSPVSLFLAPSSVPLILSLITCIPAPSFSSCISAALPPYLYSSSFLSSPVLLLLSFLTCTPDPSFSHLPY